MPSPKRFAVFATALALILAPAASTWAQQKSESEREVLARASAELELIEQLITRAEDRADKTARVYVSYDALRRDLAAVRQGIQDYIAGPRLQPRAPEPLSADYVRIQQEGE